MMEIEQPQELTTLLLSDYTKGLAQMIGEVVEHPEVAMLQQSVKRVGSRLQVIGEEQEKAAIAQAAVEAAAKARADAKAAAEVAAPLEGQPDPTSAAIASLGEGNVQPEAK